MRSRQNCVAVLLAAVRCAGDLADHIIVQPFDCTAMPPLIEKAKEIADCARALRQKELWQLSKRLIDTAQLDLTTQDAVAELNATMIRIIAIANTFGDIKSAQYHNDTDPGQTGRNDPFSSLSGTKWIVL